MLKYAGSCAAALVLSPPLFPYIHTPHTDRRALFSLPSSAAPLLARATDVDVQPKQLVVSSRASAQAARGKREVRINSDEWTDERRRPARLLLRVELMRALSGSWETLNPLLGPLGSTITLPWLERGVNETCVDGLLISNTAARSED